MHEREFGADGVRAFGSKEDRDEFRAEKEKFHNKYGEEKEVDDDMKPEDGEILTEDEIDDVKKIRKDKSWRTYKTYDGKKIDRVISSTLPKDGNEKDVPIAKLFFGKAPDSIVLKGDEAEKYADNWQKMYPDDTDKYKEYADNQGRYISIHEGSEEDC